MLSDTDWPKADDEKARHLAGLHSARHRPLLLLGLIVAGGLVLRLPLVFVHGYSADIGGSIELARNIVMKGLPQAYAPSLANPDLGVYPPAYYYVLGLLGAIYQRFFSPSFDRTLTLEVMLKLVPILGDCLVAVVSYSLVRRLSSTRAALWVAAVFLLSPPIIYNSAYWGMFGDSLYVLCILLALLAVQREYTSLAWVAITLGVLVKPQAFAFVPLIAWLTLRPVKLGQWLRAGAASGLTAAAIWLPFVLAGTLPEAIAALKQTVGLFPIVSANAHNVWYLLTLGKSWFVNDADPLFGPFSPRVMGLIGFGLAYALALVRLEETRGWPVLATAAYIAFAFFMLSTEMHENYIVPTITLLMAIWPWSRRATKLAVVLTFTALVNMVLHDPPLQGSLEGPAYLTLINLTVLNSSINVLVFIVWTGALLWNPTVTRAMAAQPARLDPVRSSAKAN